MLCVGEGLTENGETQTRVAPCLPAFRYLLPFLWLFPLKALCLALASLTITRMADHSSFVDCRSHPHPPCRAVVLVLVWASPLSLSSASQLLF